MEIDTRTAADSRSVKTLHEFLFELQGLMYLSPNGVYYLFYCYFRDSMFLVLGTAPIVSAVLDSRS
jgi:hypothetical protein